MAEIEKEQNQVVKDVIDQKYEYGFTTDVHTEIIEKGLNEGVVRLISQASWPKDRHSMKSPGSQQVARERVPTLAP